MTPLRGKAIALWSAVVGIVVLVGTGFALKDRVLEEYLLWRLESGDWAAAHRLGEMRSERAITPLIRGFACIMVLDGVIQYPLGSDPCVEALVAIGAPAVGPLTKALDSPDYTSGIYAAWTLERMAHLAGDAVPELARAVASKDHNLRLFAAHALGRIGPDAKSAVPALSAAEQDADEFPAATRYLALKEETRQAAAEALRRIRGE